jgi:hypothetical protein
VLRDFAQGISARHFRLIEGIVARCPRSFRQAQGERNNGELTLTSAQTVR